MAHVPTIVTSVESSPRILLRSTRLRCNGKHMNMTRKLSLDAACQHIKKVLRLRPAEALKCTTADSGPKIAPALEIEQVHVTGDADANNPRKADLVNRTIQDGITYAREVPMPEGMLPCGQCQAVPNVADHVGRFSSSPAVFMGS